MIKKQRCFVAITLQQKLDKYIAELARLEAILLENETYDTLSAQGSHGSETKFVDVDKTRSRITLLENKISNIEAGF